MLIGAKAACVGRGWDDPHRVMQDQDEGDPLPVVQCDYFFFKAEKEDIMCKAISAIDSLYNRTMALECEFKGLSGELEEDEDLHNKLKCWCAKSDRTSDEQIAADNAKISTLETSISEENARVAQLTEESATLEKDIAASKSELSDATAIREKQLAEYREANKATTEDIESLKAAILVLQKHHPNSASSWSSQEQNVLNRAMKGVVIFRTVPRNQRSRSMPVRAVKCWVSWGTFLRR